MCVTIVPIDESNWKQACALEVESEQLPYVCHFAPPAAEALSAAFIRPGGFEILPFGITFEDRLVGFFLLCACEDPHETWLKFFFIDRREQGRGLARASLQRIDSAVRSSFPESKRLLLIVHPENCRARDLYLLSGFETCDREAYGHPVLARSIS